jgi:hypothetical protein
MTQDELEILAKCRQGELEQLASRRERLHSELEDYLMETPHGLMLNHPLLQELPGLVDPAHAAILNQRYREKLQYVDEAVADRKWFAFIHLHERPYRIGAFMEIAHELSNKDYWFLLSDVWTDSENIWQNLEDWRELWNEVRPGKKYAMDATERKAFKRLPDEITIYRGICEGHVVNGMSWTLDREKAIWFAKRQAHDNLPQVLLTVRTSKSNVHALLLGRNENEIVIDQFEIVASEYVR